MGKDRRENTYYLIDWSYPDCWWNAEDIEGSILGAEVIDKVELDRRLKILDDNRWTGKMILFSGKIELYYDIVVDCLSVGIRAERLTLLQYSSFIHTFRKSRIGLDIWGELESLLI